MLQHIYWNTISQVDHWQILQVIPLQLLELAFSKWHYQSTPDVLVLGIEATLGRIGACRMQDHSTGHLLELGAQVV